MFLFLCIKLLQKRGTLFKGGGTLFKGGHYIRKYGMLKFHPYSILTRDIMVGFVIFCVLRVILQVSCFLAFKQNLQSHFRNLETAYIIDTIEDLRMYTNPSGTCGTWANLE